MPVSELTKQVIARLKDGRVISILSAPTRRLADARALILLSQMVYWTTRDKNALPADGWFSKATPDWIAETGLTRSYVNSCLATLHERQLIKIWQRAAKTAPWFKVDLQQLHVLCQGKPAEAPIALTRFVADANYRESIIGRPLPYYRALADAVGDALLGLFLSRCVSWQEALEQYNRLNPKKPTWGWSSSDWANDIGISRAQFNSLLKQAANLGVIEVTEIGRPFPGIWVRMEWLAMESKAILMPYAKSCVPSTIPPSTLLTAESWMLAATGELKPCTNVPSTVWTEHSCPHDPLPLPAPIPDSFGISTSSHLFQQHGSGFQQSSDGFQQSTRARGFDYLDYRTTTTPTVANAGNGQGPSTESVVVVPTETLIYPIGLIEPELAALRRVIAKAPPDRRQPLLDELSEQVQNGQVRRSSVSYLRTLVNRDAQTPGGLILEYAHRAVRRREREAELARLRTNPPPPPSPPQRDKRPERPAPEKAQARLNAMYAMLGRKPRTSVPEHHNEEITQ